MSLKEQWHNPEREARLRMEQAAGRTGQKPTVQQQPEEEKKPEVKGYRIRGQLYDKIKVSVHTMDIIIGVLVGVLVIALIVGVVTGSKM